MSDFYPISPLVGLTNTSYAAQAGVMNEKWACRVVRGKKILVEKTMADLNLDNFVGIIYGHIRVEGLSRHSVAVCAGRLMQFARRYQQSGVSPDFEVDGLVREDGSSTVAEPPSSQSEEEAPTISEPSTTVTEEPDLETTAPVGEIPEVSALNHKDAWDKITDAYAVVINEMANYGGSLPEGHVDAMFEGAADREISGWIDSSNPSSVLVGFLEMMYSCSDESQFPLTGTGTLTIEVPGCKLLEVGRDISLESDTYPVGYPCKYHENIAMKIAEITELNISVNTSSTGCVVKIELGN